MIRKTGLAITLLLTASMAAGICVAASKTASTVAALPENLDELEEIWIRGTRLVDRIADAEDVFFPLYNQANKKDDYDITCGVAYLSLESMIMGRICVPGFLGKDYGPPVYWGSCFNGFWNIRCIDGGYEPPSPQFIIMAKREDLRRQMTKVINSDPQLLAMAEHIGGLYMQMDAVKQRYRKARGLDENGRRRPVPGHVKASTGPRSS